MYPSTYAGIPALTADEYVEGKNADPVLLDLQEAYTQMMASGGATPLPTGPPSSGGTLGIPKPKRSVSISGGLSTSPRSPGLGPKSPTFPGASSPKDVCILYRKDVVMMVFLDGCGYFFVERREC